MVKNNFTQRVKSIASIPNTMQFEELLLGHTIHIDGAMAIDWTPYEFYVNGKKSHSGVNVFTLYKDNGQWKIVIKIVPVHYICVAEPQRHRMPFPSGLGQSMFREILGLRCDSLDIKLVYNIS